MIPSEFNKNSVDFSFPALEGISHTQNRYIWGSPIRSKIKMC